MSRSYSQSTAALIPVFNDDYGLFLCLQSVAPYFDEVWVNDDGSSDKSFSVIEEYKKEYKEHTKMPWCKSY